MTLELKFLRGKKDPKTCATSPLLVLVVARWGTPILRELAVLGFSDIGKVVRWRPELVYEELEDADNPDQPARQVLQSRVLVIDSATLPPEAASRLPRFRRPRTVCA